MEDDQIKYTDTLQFKLSIGLVGADRVESFEISDYFEDEDEWDAWTQEERLEALDDALRDWSANLISTGYTKNL